MFAIGISGLFCMLCGVMLMVMSRNSRLRLELRLAKIRCEELADSTWELKEAEARATSLLEAQGDLIVRRDSGGRITYVNDAYCALTGTAARGAARHARPRCRRSQQGRVSVLPDGTRLHDEQIMTADGARWLAWRDVVVWAEKAEHAEVQSVGRDVTDRIEAERALAEARDAAEAASGAKSRFLAMVSHEIRTPLNGILGMAGLLHDTSLTAGANHLRQGHRDLGRRAAVADRGDSGFLQDRGRQARTGDAAVLARPMVEDIVELLGPRAQAKGLEIASDVDERLPERVIGDATRLRQVLLNLAGNAIKFTETGGVGVVVEAGLNSGEIVFEVRDTGIGIAPGQQARIFHEFEQADGGSARKFGGTGLGLAISRRIVERMGGRIEVESTPGEGSTFRAILPLPPAEDADETQVAPPDLSGLAVLIVAPATVEASLIERRLDRWGASAMHLAPHLTDMFAQRHWDAVLVDHSIDAEAAARAGSMAQARRIVLITPAERHRLPALKEAGFAGYLVKPIRAASLKAQLVAAPGFDGVAATEAAAASAAAEHRRRAQAAPRPGRRGQRDQRAADAHAADPARPPADHGGERRHGAGALARRARRRRALRPGADGHAHAGRGRP